MYRLLYGILLVLSFTSCELLENTDFQQKPLARVNNQTLIASDLVGLIPNGTSYEDSVKIVNEYIDQWLRKQLILDKAKSNISLDKHPEIEKQVENYRDDLLIYAYENALIGSKLDTSISEGELALYYKKYQENFKLKELTLNASCLAVNKDAPKIDSVKIWMRDPLGRYADRIEEYALQYAHFFSFDTTLWFEYSALLNKMPAIKIYSPHTVLKYRTFYERDDSSNKYYLKIHNYHLAGAQAPMSMVEKKLKHIMLNRRRTSFIENMYEELYRKSFKAGQFEIIKEEDES